jgi:alkylhydroperoxidase family enzyme
MEWGDCWLAPVPLHEELAAEVRRSTGGVLPGWAPRLAAVPWVVRATARFVAARFAHMPPALSRWIDLVVSQDSSCRYCYGATRTLLKVLGYRDAQIDRIERDVPASELPPAEQAALEFARRVSHANPRPSPAEHDRLARAGWAPAAVAEIAYAAAAAGFPNRIATAFAIPPEPFERWAERPLARLVRPLLARRLRAKAAAPLPAPPPAGPCGEVVSALGDSPGAQALRATIDEALASAILPRRAKLLMLAVVGRALDCPRSEAEARVELGALGLAPATLDRVLANLGGPELDRREAALLPFARETVRYQVSALQRRTRALADALSGAEAVEAVGVAALANVVARLSTLLDRC